jgi:lipoyl(octanoyl) transferase
VRGEAGRQYTGEAARFHDEFGTRDRASGQVSGACYRGGMDTAVRSQLALDETAEASAELAGPAGPLAVSWLGRIEYRAAWALQRELLEARAVGSIPDQLLLLEHPAVLTLGRQADERFVRASAAELEARGIELIRVERGGEVTYHGPGQLVAYPIIALSRRGLLVRPLVRALEAALAATCRDFGVEADRRDGHPGCWVLPAGQPARKIGALGLRIERGVSFHGVALNIDPDLADFELLDACGMPGVVSTSIALELGRPTERPSTELVGRAGATFARALTEQLDTELAGELPA